MRYLIILALVGLAACAAQRQQDQRAAVAEAVAYCDSLQAAAALDPIRNKLAFQGSPSFQQLADRTKPAPAEREAVAAFAAAADQCNNRLATVLDTYSPPLSAPFRAAMTRAQTSLAMLYNGELTFGQANAASAENQRMYAQAVTDYQAALNQQEAARQAAISSAVLGQSLRNLSRPSTSNCNWIGGTWSCTSY